MPWVGELGFDQVNVDLIAGMVGETWESWRQTVQKTIDLDPDSVTIYQMELPYNTVFSKDVLAGDGSSLPLANWDTKRKWHAHAFAQFAAAGYQISSAYTATKKDRKCSFVYRDAVWHGQDMLGAGVASFSHMSDVHYQNASGWDAYLEALEADRLPLNRAFATAPDERLTREMILQLKLGEISPAYFRDKFDVDITEQYSSAYAALRDEGMLTLDDNKIRLTHQGLLRVDQLLPEFYAPKYRNARYT